MLKNKIATLGGVVKQIMRLISKDKSENMGETEGYLSLGMNGHGARLSSDRYGFSKHHGTIPSGRCNGEPERGVATGRVDQTLTRSWPACWPSVRRRIG